MTPYPFLLEVLLILTETIFLITPSQFCSRSTHKTLLSPCPIHLHPLFPTFLLAQLNQSQNLQPVYVGDALLEAIWEIFSCTSQFRDPLTANASLSPFVFCFMLLTFQNKMPPKYNVMTRLNHKAMGFWLSKKLFIQRAHCRQLRLAFKHQEAQGPVPFGEKLFTKLGLLLNYR